MTEISKALSTPDDLLEAGLVNQASLLTLQRVAARYVIAITPAVVGEIDRAVSNDPIARQFVPDERELDTAPDEEVDPIGDAAHSPVAGLVHRYPDRVLLKIASVCPVYCRFCFRRETVGPMLGSSLSAGDFAKGVDYIKAHPEIWEVILTGGDPLVLSPRRIGHVTALLATIPHVKVLRWHTRVPIVAPERVTPALVAALKSNSKAVYIGLHTNHPRELTPAARVACAALVDAGIVMVSQTVLLRGVNDDAETLEQLMRALVETRIKPYYLHHMDRAPGTKHFRTTIAKGQSLMQVLRGRLSGLAQPAYVLDIPGGHGKMPIGPGYVCVTEAGIEITDYQGVAHSYCECSSDEPGACDDER